MGFFMTASSTWDEMVKKNKKESKGFLKSISDKIQKQILFNPLMLAKEKIFTLFNKKLKLEESELKNFNPKNFNKFK